MKVLCDRCEMRRNESTDEDILACSLRALKRLAWNVYYTVRIYDDRDDVVEGTNEKEEEDYERNEEWSTSW